MVPSLLLLSCELSVSMKKTLIEKKKLSTHRWIKNSWSHVTEYTAWKVWCLFDAIVSVFSNNSQQPTFMQLQEAMPPIERLTVLLYHCTSSCLITDKCRRKLFCQGRSIDNIQPTSVILWKHTLWSCYITGHMWAQLVIRVQTLLPLENCWWKFENSKLIPHWIDLPEAAAAIRDLIKCACEPEKGCRGWCKCVQSQLPCAELCVRKEQCERE